MATERSTFLDSLAQDVKYAVRTLGRNKGYAAVSLLTLILGLGGAITAFVIGDRVLLRPLPYPDAHKLVSVMQAEGASGGLPITIRQFADLRATSRSFASLDASIPTEVNLRLGDAIVPTQSVSVTGGFFSTIGVSALVGRALTPADAAVGVPPAAVLSHRLWRRSFGSDVAVVGRTITMSNRVYMVVGVMPPSFAVPEEADVWVSCAWCDRPPPNYRVTAQVVGRLDRVSEDAARAELAVIWPQVHANGPPIPGAGDTRGRITAVPLQEVVVGSATRRIQLLAAAMGIILLIGCANLASATMARNVTRLRELAVRSALGGDRRRLVQQLAVESLVLAVAAGIAGLGVAAALLRLITTAAAAQFPRIQELSMDGRTMAFASALAIMVAVVIGVLPALQIAGRNLTSHLAGYSSPRTRGPRTRAARILLAAEIALCLLVVTAAGLAARSLHLVYSQPMGIDTHGLATIKPELDFRRYRTADALALFYDQALARIRSIPGVTGAGAAITGPLGEAWINLIEVEGRPELRRPIAGYNLVTEGFFEAVGVPLRAGRLLLETDTPASEPVTVINEAMAQRYWPGEDPIGRRFRAVGFERGGPVWLRIVGVVGDMRTLSLETRYQPIHYVNARQQPAMLPSTTIIARTSGSASALVPELRTAVRAVDAQARGITMTIEERAQTLTRERRQATAVLVGVAALGLTLAGIGIYGVLAYSVAQRLREIGIRMALGATAARVVRGTVAELWMPVTVGVVMGLAAARAASQTLSSLVFGITPTDPLVLGSAAVIILMLAALAAYVPARRAAGVDPTLSLRSE